MPRPDPWTEIRPLRVRTLRGASFWSPRPVTRLDMVPGAYDEISSAEIPGFTDSLLGALPDLWEHGCTVGGRGGFVTRLRRGTYAPHVVEHVALALQAAAGHEVGYGRARGGDAPGEYTVVVEHRHAAVGARAVAAALEAVRRACAGTLGALDDEVAALRELAATPDAPLPDERVACGLTGGGDVEAVVRALLDRGVAREDVRLLPPRTLLETGLPYAGSRTAVVLDAALIDVPPRYAEPDRAAQLVAVIADAVPRGGTVVVPAAEREVQARICQARCVPAVFSVDALAPAEGDPPPRAAATVRGGRIAIETGEGEVDAGPLDPHAAPEPQLAAALAAWVLEVRDG
jgi:hypothetical protein